jgi:DNA polymerase III epsilon subunit-like protein
MTVLHRYNLRSYGSIRDVQIEPKKKIKSTSTQTETPIIHDKNLLLVFDTETTGLLKRNYMTKQLPPIENRPFITQLSFIIYDKSQNKKIETYDSFIKIDISIEIPEIVTNLTGITQEKCQEQGQPITDVLVAFYNAYRKCGTIVAHNMVFDSDMILTELERHHNSMVSLGCEFPSCIFNTIYNISNNVETVCTMISSINICNIIVESKNKGPLTQGEYYINETSNLNSFVRKRMGPKWPKLSELHMHFFGTIPNGLHDAMVDTETCLNCYLKMR